MTSETLVRQLETYSNAIVAFTVLQGLAYSFAFGTDEFFNCTVKTAPRLAELLAVTFLLVGGLAVVATLWLGNRVKELAGEFRSTVGRIYAGKVVVVLIFVLLPLSLTVYYGARDYPSKLECKVAKK